jgi:4-carboxymuconolactone decarboxylase
LCARAERSAFEWYAHEPLAAAAGVPQPMIDAIASGATPTIGDPVSDAVVKITASVIEDGDVSDEGYAAASRALSEAQLVEVLVLIGYYRLISGLLRVFRVPLPADARSPFSAEGAGEGPTG